MAASLRISASAALLLLATGTAAAAERPDLTGRWRNASEMRTLMLDISRCGDGYCGREVLASGCGRTVLKVHPEKPAGTAFEGTIDLPGEKRRYQARLQVVPDGPEILIDAYVTAPTYEHREIPFSEQFFRIGLVGCPAGPSS